MTDTDLMAKQIEEQREKIKRLKEEVEAAKKLCQIYFEIAEEYFHEDAIRQKRDEKLEQVLKNKP